MSDDVTPERIEPSPPPVDAVHPAWVEVAAFLEAPATHGLTEPPRRIDTHAAVVILAGPLAYKLKRPVVFPFLDYATVEKRRRACLAEIAVDRPIAPAIYRRVVAVTREADGRLALDGAGVAVEWLVEMNRFDEEATLDRVLARGPLAGAFVDRLAAETARAETRARRRDAGPWVADLGRYVDQNAEAFADRPDLFDAGEAARLAERCRARLADLDDLFAVRGRLGFVRLGHGDLHAGNVAIIDGRPQLFDAIEFDDAIATGDLLYDAGFLVMDLAERGDASAACRMLSRFLIETARLESEAARRQMPDADPQMLAAAALLAQIDGLAALGLLLSIRAAIRAKIAAARAVSLGAAARDASQAEARRLFAAAIALIEPAEPRLVVLGGRSGGGKSTLAFALAPGLAPGPGALVLRSDEIRKLLMGVEPTTRLGPEGYARAVTEATYTLVEQAAARALAGGRSVIVDAVSLRDDERRAFAAIATACEVRFDGLWLDLDEATALARVAARDGDASDADAAVVRRQFGLDAGPVDWPRIDAAGPSDVTLAAARAVLGV